MALCCKLIKDAFPKIDDDIYHYVESVLETSIDDFEEIDDVYEAIGGVLHEVAAEKTEEDIRDLCRQLMTVLRPNRAAEAATKNGLHKMLHAPVHLGQLAESQTEAEAADSIWMKIQDDAPRGVDTKKLEKAEQLLVKKQNKKENIEVKPVNKYGTREVTASQIIR